MGQPFFFWEKKNPRNFCVIPKIQLSGWPVNFPLPQRCLLCNAAVCRVELCGIMQTGWVWRLVILASTPAVHLAATWTLVIFISLILAIQKNLV